MEMHLKQEPEPRGRACQGCPMKSKAKTRSKDFRKCLPLLLRTCLAHCRRAPFALAAASASHWTLTLIRGGASSPFPAKRELKRELAKAWQAWTGNQTSCRSLVRSLVCMRSAHPAPHASEESSKGAGYGGGRCSHCAWVGARPAPRARRPQSPPPPLPPPSRRTEVKKVGQKFH